MIKINGHKINVTMFPDGTSQVWKQSPKVLSALDEEVWNFEWIFENEGEIFQIYQFMCLAAGLEKDPVETTLYTPYLPYARQDKAFSNESCFALRVLEDILLEQFDKVIVFDAHNPDFFNGDHKLYDFVNILPTEKVRAIVAEHGVDAIVFPDKGARTRYGGLIDLPSFYADKVREQLTGEILGLTFEVPPPEGANILVWDDLCDGGRTFIELSKILQPLAPKDLTLYVSHGIFSKGTGCLFSAGYSKVYTKDGLVQFNQKEE